MELLFELVFALLPVWGTMLLLRVLSRPMDWGDFVVHGEFAIYSAALVGPSIHQIWQLRRKPRAPGLGFLLLAIIGLLASTLIFAASVLGTLIPEFGEIDRDFMSWVSILLFSASICFVYLVKVLDNIHTSADVPGEAHRDVDALEKAVRELG